MRFIYYKVNYTNKSNFSKSLHKIIMSSQNNN